MSADLLLIIIFLGLIVVLSLWILTLEWRLKKIFRGHNSQDLESVIADLGQTVDEVLQKAKRDDALFEDIYRRLRRTLQRISTIRFNPFSDQGSNQSFATALMDEDGNGVVMSSLYSRDKVSVYAKPLVHFQSEYELSKEESSAVGEARKKS